jgi:hypothetical protein
MSEPIDDDQVAGGPSASVAPLATLQREAPTRHDGGDVLASRTDWKDGLLALLSVTSIVTLASEVIDDEPGPAYWRSVVGSVAPLVLLVVRRVTGYAPRTLRRGSSAVVARVVSAVAIVAGVSLLWEATTSHNIVAGLVGLVSLGVGAAIDATTVREVQQ